MIVTSIILNLELGFYFQIKREWVNKCKIANNCVKILLGCSILEWVKNVYTSQSHPQQTRGWVKTVFFEESHNKKKPYDLKFQIVVHLLCGKCDNNDSSHLQKWCNIAKCRLK